MGKRVSRNCAETMVDSSSSSSLLAGGARDGDAEISEAEMVQLRQEAAAHIVTAVNLAVKSAGHLNNLLPSGTFLFFQFLLPIVSDNGNCRSRPASSLMTALLLASCALWCLLLSFTDTFKAPNGKLYHGFATFRGLWLPPSAPPPAPARLSRFRLQPLDFLHALLSLSVFAATAFFTPNVTDCLLPDSTIPAQLQNSLPLVVGFVASFVCILLPSTRRGFDQPLLERLDDQTMTEN